MFGLGKKKTTVIAPCAGNIIPLEEVADATFARKTVGDGFAIVPTVAEVVEVCAPISGTLTQVFNANHAFAITGPQGLDVLVHVGIDTKNLAGGEFSRLVEQGVEVEAGTPVLRVQLATLVERGIDITTPVVFPDKRAVKEVMVTTKKTVTAAAPIAEVSHG